MPNHVHTIIISNKPKNEHDWHRWNNLNKLQGSFGLYGPHDSYGLNGCDRSKCEMNGMGDESILMPNHLNAIKLCGYGTVRAEMHGSGHNQ